MGVFRGEGEVADDGVVQRLVQWSWRRTLWAAHRVRNPSLRVCRHVRSTRLPMKGCSMATHDDGWEPSEP